MEKVVRKGQHKDGQKKKPRKRLVTFGESFDFLRSRVWIIYILALLIVGLVETTLRAQALFQAQPVFLWLAGVAAGILFALLAAWARRDGSFLRPDFYRQFTTREAVTGIAGGLALAGWIFAADYLLGMIFPEAYTNIRAGSRFYTLPLLLLAVLGSGLIRPLGEEMLFRGYFLPAVMQNKRMIWGLVLSAVLYGLRTLDPFQFFVFFVSGLLLGVLYLKGSLRTSMMANITAHLTVLMIIFLFIAN